MSTFIRICCAVCLMSCFMACRDKKAPDETTADLAREAGIKPPASMEELGKMPKKMVDSVEDSLEQGAAHTRQRAEEQ